MPKAEISQRVHDAAERLELQEHLSRKPKALSGGQRQRVALARAIARRPGVLLFDEPLSNLDALLRDRMRSELKLLHADIGATSVYVTHDQEEAMTLSDRIAVMSRGHLEQYGTPTEIYREPATEFVAGFVGKPRMNLMDATVTAADTVRPVGTEVSVAVPTFDLGGHSTVRLGIRPTDIDLSETHDGDPHGTVVLVEPLGNSTDVTVNLADIQLIARVPGFSDLRPGDSVSIRTSQAETHLFDKDAHERLPAKQ